MLDGLRKKFDTALQAIRGKASVTTRDIEEAMRGVRLALLEADVNFKVAKEFCARVSEKALGETVLKSLNAEQQIIKIVHEELIATMGSDAHPITFASTPPTVILLVGLQGSGKTTTAAKLALYLRREHSKSPFLVPADVYRPAAITQLTFLGKQLSIPVFPSQTTDRPEDIVTRAVAEAKQKGFDTVIIDTAGRLQIDDALMHELKSVVKLVAPDWTYLVADAMTGQEAVNVATGFNSAIALSGLILTKLDGDARGGAALSIRAVTGIPITFVGLGEKPDNFERFHPDRLASRILGMGDVLSLIEKAQKEVSLDEAKDLEKKLRKNAFTLEDFLSQLKMVKRMGSIGSLTAMIPGMAKIMDEEKSALAEREMKRVEAIILSMTPKERRNHQLIDGSRRKRIAAGSGTSVEEVNKLLKQFLDMKKMMTSLAKGGLEGLMSKMGKMGGNPALRGMRR